MRASKTIKWMLLLVISGLVLSTCAKDWPYYKATVEGGYTTETNMFMRGTWGEQAHFPLGHEAQITARAICYPREPDGFQPCHLVINILHPNEIKIDFKEGEFIVRDPSNHEHRFDTRNWSREYNKLTGTILIIVHLSYKKPPGEFELLLPDITVNNNVQVIPAFKFEYEDTFPYQFVPFFANY